MPTYEISGNDQILTLSQAMSADPALRIAGNRNSVTLGASFTAAGTGPAVLMTGADTYLLLHWGSSLWTSGIVAIQGSDFADTVYNNRGAIHGDVLLGGGNDIFQNNFDCLVGRVYGGEGNDALRTFQGTVAVHYFGENGNDYLSGGSAADELDGGTGDDSLTGNEGNDLLTGGSGIDRLTGGLGNDQLAGGGDEGDLAIYAGNWADFSYSIAGGAGTVTDTEAADGDQGADTLTGIHQLRFTDQEVDTRLARDELLLTTAGETFTNDVDRYGFTAVELRGENVLFINEAEIRGTAVSHLYSGALGLNIVHGTIENRAGASIIGFDDAIGMLAPPPVRDGIPLRLINDGLVRSLEEDAIDVICSLDLVNGETGVIEAADLGIQSVAAVAARNSSVTIANAGLIRGGDMSIDAGHLTLTNSGTISGRIDIGAFSSIDNMGSISGGYTASGALTFVNSGQSSGDLALDVGPVGQLYMSYPAGYTYGNLDNRSVFAGNIRITGEAAFNSLPASHRDYLAIIANSGTITGSVTSDPTLKAIGGVMPDASFVEQVTNSGTITGDVRLGDGNDSVVNSGTIGGIVDLGAGADSFTQRSGARVQQILMGAGDDVFRIEAPLSPQQAASGGDGYDRFVIAEAALDVANAVDGFEQLEVSNADIVNLTGFNDFQAVLLAEGGGYNFLQSSNPLADLVIANLFVIVTAGSRFRSVTGGNGAEDVQISDSGANGVGDILGDVLLGAGNDRFTFKWTQNTAGPILGGAVDGGAGTDNLLLIATAGRTIDVSRFTGFETINSGYATSVAVNERLINANGFTKITAIANSHLTLDLSNSPDATLALLAKSTTTIGAATIVNLVTAANGAASPAAFAAIQAADETRLVTLTNAGTIRGDVILYLGSDQYDGRNGSVAGTVYGLAGNDTIRMGAGNDHADGGHGNDWLDGGAGDDILAGGDGDDQLFGGDGVDTLSGGAGKDAFGISGYAPGGALVITDFAAGDAGDKLSWKPFLQSWLTGWNGISDPFAARYLSLVQSGADVLVRIDRDGAAGPGGFVTFLTLRNVSAPALTAFNLDGIAPRADISGTEGNDVIQGTSGNDLIEGLGGTDQLFGNDGDDRLEGGEGTDYLEGGAGNDVQYGGAGNDFMIDNSATPGDEQLYGEDGNDFMVIEWFTGTIARNVLVDGGIGNDIIDFYVPGRFVDQATLIGGEGDDRIAAEGGLNVTIDAGSGADRVGLRQGPTNFMVTLGTGADILSISSNSNYPDPANLVVTDFETGDAGDRLELLAYCDLVLTNWDHATNPFGTGHLRLTQSGAHTIVQIDRDGAGSAQGFVNLVTFQNLTAGALTAFNLGGFPSDGSKPVGLTITGTSGANTLTGTLGDDIIQGLGGNDQIRGRAGDDQIDGGDQDDGIAGDQGDDVIHGGAGADGMSGGLGDDMLYGDAGNDSLGDRDGGDDQLFGGAGYDWISVDRSGAGPGDNILIDAGDDGALIQFFAQSRFVDTVTIQGSDSIEAGDHISVNGGGIVTVDAGAGDDRITIGNLGGAVSVTFGAGTDSLYLLGLPIGGLITVEDLAGGAGGDRIYVRSVFNPYQMIQRGGDAILQVDMNGSAAGGYVDYVIVKDVLASDLVLSSDFYYWAPGDQIDDPAVAVDDNIHGLEGELITGGALLVNDSDADGPPLSIAMVNGSAANIGQFITLASGAQLRVTAGGGWDYRAIGATLTPTPDFGSGASNLYTYDSFTYTLAGGGTATVTVQVRGVDSADTLRGTAGDDTLSGGYFDDLYFVENAGDVVVELNGRGNDRVVASVSYALGGDAAVETLEAIAGTAPINLTGNAFNQNLIGNAGSNVLHGGGGADVLIGLGGNDVYYADVAAVQVREAAGGGTDRLFTSVSYALAGDSEIEVLSTNNHAATDGINLTGNSFDNVLIGNAGNNLLHGGGGGDLLIGLAGQDIYYIDVASTQLIEYEGGGNDALYVSVSYTLVNGEVETLSANDYLSTDALNLTGNLYAQTIIGNAGNNILNGGGGADYLIGLGGNDIYYIDVPSVTIQESPGGGNDIVYTSVSYALTPGMDIETLSTNDYSAVTSINLTGNGLANQLLGNAGNNAFIGGGGADVMFGMGGDDTYYIDVASVQIVENSGAGNDIVYAGVSYALASGVDVEILSTNNYASTDAIDLVGNAVNQTLLGNDGANFLDGGSGNDVLRGFGGADTFAFTQAIDADMIVDFVSGTDRIALDDTLFVGVGGPGALNANVFVVGNAAADADDRIIYNQASGQLFYDADGNGAGAAVLFANLAGAPVIAASDFLVI